MLIIQHLFYVLNTFACVTLNKEKWIVKCSCSMITYVGISCGKPLEVSYTIHMYAIMYVVISQYNLCLCSYYTSLRQSQGQVLIIT